MKGDHGRWQADRVDDVRADGAEPSMWSMRPLGRRTLHTTQEIVSEIDLDPL